MESVQTAQAGQADELARLVGELVYKPSWQFSLGDMERYGEQFKGTKGLTLRITAQLPDSCGGADLVPLDHLFEVPTLTWDRRTWMRWLFDRIDEVELHEQMEWFRIGGAAPYFPEHGRGPNPYEIREKDGWDEPR